MEKPFVHLHNHSEYSLLDGSTRLSDLAEAAAAYGMPAVALTDHGNLFGALYFEKACKKAGVKPIIGCEVYIAPKARSERNPDARYYHMCLFAKNQEGYKNLLILTSSAYTEGFYYRPRIDDELLAEHKAGLAASSACVSGEIAQHLLNGQYALAKERAQFYDALFGRDSFYLEIQHHGFPDEAVVRREMKKLAAETGIPLIATNDVHYLRKEDEKDNDIFICIGTQRKRSDASRMTASPNCYFRSPDEMYELFSDVPEALTNTLKLAESCNLTLPQPGPILPEYVIPQEFASPEEYLKHLVFKGIEKRYGAITETLKERARFELDTINAMGFPGYFLIVWDFIDWAKRNGISVGPGRGSGVGSIVAYALSITDIDPLKYNLLFERFLNPERISMPDFDIDFNDERRDEVVAYVTNKYGREHVAGIVTFSTLATKAALKDVARVLDISFDESNQIAKAVPAPNDLPEGVKLSVKTALEHSPALQEFYNRGGLYQELFETAIRLEGLTRGVGTHACGKVIGKSPVVDYVPLIYDQKSSSINTAFESKIIEDCGLVKMDFLGLKTLSLIDRCTDMVRRSQPDFDIEKIPENDAATFKLFSEGRTQAIFQFESQGMQKILKEAQPASIEDLIALNALYRPGPMQFIPEFIKGKQNPKNVKYFDPCLEKILEPTYGVIVYQEQVMQVAQIYAGYSLGAADLLRRAMGKKKKEEMDKQQAVFIAGALKNGHSEKEARALFEILLPFAGYGFNKSHAAAYSVLAYKTAYLKAHYPAEFMAANLTSEINNPDAFKGYLDEARGMGLEIAPPDINASEKNFAVENGKIYYGLQGLKGLGAAAADEIVAARHKNGPFKSFTDFLERIPQGICNKRVAETVLFAGLFDSCEKMRSRGEIAANLERMTEWANNKKSEESQGAGLFGFDDQQAYPPFRYEAASDFSEDEKLRMEKEILGFYVSGHPLEKYRGAWQQQQNIDLSRAQNALPRKRYAVVGLLRSFEVRTTKKGTRMASGLLEDFNGTLKLVAFERNLAALEPLLASRLNEAVLLYGIIDTDRGEPQMRLEEAHIPDITIKPAAAKPAQAKELHIFLSQSACNETSLRAIKEQLAAHPGSATVYLRLQKDSGNETIVKADKAFSANVSPQLADSLQELNLAAKIEAL